VWALYMFSEKVLSFVGKKCHIAVLIDGLPEVPPNVCAVALLVSLAPALVYAWKYAGSTCLNGSSNLFINAVVYCAFCGFMFSYHVHEKAIMTAIIPLTLLSTTSVKHARLYLLTCAVGHFGLFPLLYRRVETPFKLVSYLMHLVLSENLLGHYFDEGRKAAQPILTRYDKIGFLLLMLVFLFAEVVHPILLKPHGKLEFLPLMIQSVVCALGLVYCWVYSWLLLRRCVKDIKEKPE